MNHDGLLPHQPAAAEALLRSLECHGGALDCSDMGTGKCLGRGVPILTFDGSVVLSENVRAGMELMGDDGTSRRVLSTSSGIGPMFRIRPNRRESWTCNGDHILVLKSTNAPQRGWTGGEVREMTVREWFSLGIYERTWRWKLFASDGWERPDQSQEYSPRIFGMWLGDGCIASGALSTSSDDPELEEVWAGYFERRGYRIHRHQDPRSKSRNITPREGPWQKWTQNTLTPSGEKRIPARYMNGSRAQRLQLLSGLLDTDGFLAGPNTFELVTKWPGLASQIVFLCRSLGFLVSQKTKVVRGTPGNAGGTYQRLHISGETAQIPTIAPRRRAAPWTGFKDPRVFGFVVEPTGVGEFFGVVLDGNRRFLLGDATVTHNTFTAGAVLRHLDLPSLVVCPAVSITSWNRMGAQLGTEFDCLNYEMVRTGRTPFGTWENPRPKSSERDYFCTCCQLKIDPYNHEKCEVRYDGIHCLEHKIRPHNYGKFSWADGLRFLVFDEIHRACALDSLHSEMLLAARRQKIRVLGLSATVATTPLNFKALGFVLGMHSYVDTPEHPGFYRWAAGYGCGRDGLRGFVFRGTESEKREEMARLNSELFPERGVRVRIEDLGESFPDSQVTAELYDLEQGGQIEACYREMASALSELREHIGDSISSHPLTRILRARQEIELLKIPIYEELVRQGRENGHSVAIFVNFTQTLEELCKRLKTQCRVDGSQTGVAGMRRRQQNIDAFQANRERVIILNGQAGGVSISLHDEHGGFPRLGVVSLSYSAVVVRQILGRLRRAGGKSKALYRIPLVAGTVEERVHKLVTPKLNNLDSLNDGDLWTQNLPLTRGDFSAMLETKQKQLGL